MNKNDQSLIRIFLFVCFLFLNNFLFHNKTHSSCKAMCVTILRSYQHHNMKMIYYDKRKKSSRSYL